MQGIAAIGEKNGAVHEDDRRAGRTGKAGDPGQALIGVRQVFVLVLVLVRDDEAVQPHLPHLGAQGGDICYPLRRLSGDIEMLEVRCIGGHGGVSLQRKLSPTL